MYDLYVCVNRCVKYRIFFFFKQKTAYEMRISDWSSDVCASDLTYPGAACDVQSHLYSYSFEPKHDWTRKFGLQVEIRQYMEDCVRKYGLAAHLRFHQEVVSAEFDRARGLWKITTAEDRKSTRLNSSH